MCAAKRQVRGDGLLRQRDFRHLWAADAISQLGSRASYLALPLLAVVTLQATTFEVSLIKTLQTLAYLLLGLQVGAWCDRMRRRPVLVVADLGRALALGSIPLAAAFGVLTLWQFYAAVFVTGVLTVFFDVAHQSYLPRLVERDRLIDGNAMLRTNQSVAAVAAPTVAGALVQWFGAPAAVLLDAASYLWSVLWLRGIRAPEPKPLPVPRSLRREIREGMAVVLGDPILRAISFSNATLALCQNLNSAILIVFLVREVGLSPGLIGLLSSCGLIGAVVGATLARRLTALVGGGRLLWIALIVEGLAYLCYPLVGTGWRVVFLPVAGFVASVCVIVVIVVQVSFQQARCPDELMGRVNATMNFLYWGMAPVGSIAAGLLATTIGFRPTLLLAGLGVLLSATWLLASPARRLRDLPTAQATADAN